jgi:hypothetical protein
MADLLTSIRAEIDARLAELAPAIAEYERLSTAAGALTAEGRAASRSAARSAPQTPAPSARASTKRVSTKKSARPKRPARRRGISARARKREDIAHSPTGQAILAALEHGSHTLAELVLVTALPASDIREALRPLRTHGAIVKTERDGRAAYALPTPEAK